MTTKSFLKKKAIHASEQRREDVVEDRKNWVNEQPSMDPQKLVFLDECGVNTDMTRLYGRAVGKKRVHDHAPLKTPKKTTIVSSVRLDGSTAYKYFQGSLNGDIFMNYIKETLVPTLHVGDIVIMDNLPCHKVKGVAEAIADAGAVLLPLPPYSPDFNPTEMMWSKIKSLLRKWKPRDIQSLHSLISKAFSAVSISDIAGWFSACGYSLS